MGLDREYLQFLHKSFRSLAAAFDAERNNAAGPFRQVFLRALMVFVPGKPAIADPGRIFIFRKEFRDSLGIFTVAGHPDMQAFQAEVQKERALGALDGTEVAHELADRLGDIGASQAETFGVNNTVVAVIRRGQAGELFRIRGPVKFSAVHDTAADSAAVPVHIFGGGMGYDISAPFDGAAVDRRGESVVHDQRDTVSVRCGGKHFDIQDAEGGIGDGFAENSFRVGTESGVQFLRRAVRGHEGEINAHLFHGDGKEIVGAAIDRGAGNHMIPAIGNIEHRVEIRRLAGGSQHGGGAAFQRADLRGDRVACRVLKAGIEIARGLQVKELSHILAGVVFESGGLDDRDLAGFAVPGSITSLDAEGLDGCHRCVPSF